MDSSYEEQQSQASTSSSSQNSTPKRLNDISDADVSRSKRQKFDFWNQSSQPSKEPEKINELVTEHFADLKVGISTNQRTVFRVSFKSEKKTRKIGVMFDFYAMDISGEITVVCFPDTTEKFFDMIQVNDVYEMCNFNVKEENTEYSRDTGLGVEIILNSKTVLNKILDSGDVPAIPFSFVNLKDIETAEIKAKIDLVAVVVNVWDSETTKSGYHKRDIALTDKTKQTIVMTLWGSRGELFAAEIFSVLAIRNAIVSEYQGIRSLNCRSDTLIWIDSNIPECFDLKEWFDKEREKKTRDD